MKTKRIQYEDDIVVVYDENGNEVYRGLEDYEPNRREAWHWDAEKGYYTLGGWVKKCLDI